MQKDKPEYLYRKIEKMIEEGSTPEVACAWHKIPVQEFQSWGSNKGALNKKIQIWSDKEVAAALQKKLDFLKLKTCVRIKDRILLEYEFEEEKPAEKVEKNNTTNTSTVLHHLPTYLARPKFKSKNLKHVVTTLSKDEEHHWSIMEIQNETGVTATSIQKCLYYRHELFLMSHYPRANTSRGEPRNRYVLSKKGRKFAKELKNVKN